MGSGDNEARCVEEWRNRLLANTKPAKKAMRVAERRRLRNKPIRTAIRTYIKTAAGLITKNDEGAPAALQRAIRSLDKAVSKGIVHRNNAARRKSRLMRKFNRA